MTIALRHSESRSRFARVLVMTLVMAASMILASGCNIAAPIAYIATGPPKVDARHTLDGSRITVIFIDDRSNRAPRRSLRTVAAESAEQTLMTQGVLPSDKVITTRAMMRLSAQERFNEPMSIAEMGRAVGADVVIYATIDAWTLSPDGVQFSPGAQVRVKIIDAEEDRRIWPSDHGGYPVVASMPPQTRQLPTGAERDQAHLGLAQLLGVNIAQLFYKHERNPLSGSIRD